MHAQSNAEADGWLCLRADCTRAALKKLPNFANRTECFGCGRPKCEAVNPPLASAVPWAPRKSSQNAAPKKAPSKPATEEAAPKKKQVSWKDIVSPANGNGTATQAASDAQPPAPKPKWQNMALSSDELESISMIQPAVTGILRAMQAERVPLPREDMADAAAVFADLTSALQPCASIERKAELSKEVQSLSAALLSLDAVRDASIIGPIQQRLTQAKEELEKLDRKTPSDAALSSALREAKATYQRGIQDRIDRLAKGVTNSAARRQTRTDDIASLRKQVDLLEEILQRKDRDAATAFSELNAAQESLEQTVLTMFDSKLQTLTSQESNEMDDVELMGAAITDDSSRQPHIREASTAVEAQLQNAREELQRTLDTLQAQRAYIAAEHAFHQPIQWTVSAMPKIKLECDADRAAASLWFHFLSHWDSAGSSEHFSIAGVATYAQEHAEEAAAFFAKLVGKNTLDLWPAATTKDAIVPRQIALAAQAAIQRLKAEHLQFESSKQAAGSSYAQVTAHNKKRRAAVDTESGTGIAALIC